MTQTSWTRRALTQVATLLCAVAFVGAGVYPTLKMAKHDCAMQTPTLVKEVGCRGVVSTDDIEVWQKPMDRFSYIHYARWILANHDFGDWGATIWPPAFPLLVAAELKTLGHDGKDANYQVHMALLLGGVWALVLWLWFNALRPLGWARFASGFILLLPTFREWSLGGGVLTSESLSLALLLATLGVLVLGLQRGRLSFFVAAGILMAASAYARGVFSALWEATLAGLLFCVVLRATVRFCAEWARRVDVPLSRWARSFVLNDLRADYGRPALILLLMLLTVEAGLFPWKHHMAAKGGTYQMTGSAKFEVEVYMWTPSLPGFVLTGNTPCQVDPALCEAIGKSTELSTYANKQRLALATFLSRPGKWLRVKSRAFGTLWFGASIHDTDRWEILENLLYALCYLVGMAALALKARTSAASLLGLLTGALFLVGNAAVFIMMHFEYRYGLPLKLFAFALPWVAFALRRGAQAVPAAALQPAASAAPSYVVVA